jgi:hypothetical protein
MRHKKAAPTRIATVRNIVFFPPSSRTPSDGYLLTTKEKQEVGAPRLKVRRKLLEKVFAES